MTRISRRTLRSLNSAGRSAYKITDKAAIGLAHWAAKDHTGITKRLANMPAMGFLDTLKFILMQLLLSILAAIVTGVLTFVLIGYGIPYLLQGIFM